MSIRHLNIFKKRKTKRESYHEWRRNKRVRKAERFKSLRDKIYLAHFLVYVGHYKKSVGIIIGLVAINSILALILPYSVRYTLNFIVPQRDFQLLNGVILGTGGLLLSYSVLRYLERRLVVTFSMNLITEIRSELFKHQIKLSLSYFEKASPGKLISKLTYSIYLIKLLVETFAYVCFRETITILAILILASVIDWRLTLILLGLGPFLILYIRRLNLYMMDVAVKLQTKNDQILKVLDRAFNSVKLFQIFSRAQMEGDKFEDILNQDKKYRIQRTMVYVTNTILITLLASLVLLLGLWYGSRQIILGHLKHGDVVAYMVCIGMLIRPISEFVRATAYLQAGKVGIRTIFSVFENTSPIPEPLYPLVPKKRLGEVEFRKVWFEYEKGKSALKNISFKVQAGQKVLIVGRSGAGKSTLFNLILRLYDCERGSILIDGVSMRRMRLDDLRNYFTVATQDQLHIEDTLLNNILLGSDLEGSQEMESAIEKAIEIGRQMEMNSFITSLKKRFGQKVDAAGMSYSRGELQKIALMRAATKEAPIVLLDEPTASLDHRSEQDVLRIINQQFKQKTMLIISHRPLPELMPDWIVVLKNGWIEAQGNHHYLMDQCRYYRQLMGRRQLTGMAA